MEKLRIVQTSHVSISVTSCNSNDGNDDDNGDKYGMHSAKTKVSHFDTVRKKMLDMGERSDDTIDESTD